MIGGAERGKAIIILNPAEPPMLMRDTIFCAIPEDADRDAIAQSISEMVAEVQSYVPGYRLRSEPQFDDRDGLRRPSRGRHVRRGRGSRGLPAAVLGQPRHHDRCSHQGRGGDRQGIATATAQEEHGMSDRHLLQPGLDVRMTDSSLRDGSHDKRHQFTRTRCAPSSPRSTGRVCRSSR